ncbi:MAG TPA: class I SAM-dependent methyltransferase [Stellaceae bacterium]|nr:class I SAM-dependent methyltransferase [Stellaceae bacterium]
MSATLFDRPKAPAYDAEFYNLYVDRALRSAEEIVPVLRDLIGMRSVCDVGCGTATWLSVFIAAGVTEVMGVDGDYVDRKMLRIPATKFRPADLNRPFALGRRFDAAMSLEVAEHLRPERAPGLVSDLTALAPVVIFSAAIPGQGGTEHINEQWPDYWANLFSEHDYVLTDPIRPRLWDNEKVDPWYRQNMFVFCARGALDHYPKLAQARGPALPLRAVHPQQYLSQVNALAHPTLRYVLKALPQACYKAAERRLQRD